MIAQRLNIDLQGRSSLSMEEVIEAIVQRIEHLDAGVVAAISLAQRSGQPFDEALTEAIDMGEAERRRRADAYAKHDAKKGKGNIEDVLNAKDNLA